MPPRRSSWQERGATSGLSSQRTKREEENFWLSFNQRMLSIICDAVNRNLFTGGFRFLMSHICISNKEIRWGENFFFSLRGGAAAFRRNWVEGLDWLNQFVVVVVVGGATWVYGRNDILYTYIVVGRTEKSRPRKKENEKKRNKGAQRQRIGSQVNEGGGGGGKKEKSRKKKKEIWIISHPVRLSIQLVSEIRDRDTRILSPRILDSRESKRRRRKKLSHICLVLYPPTRQSL